MKRLIQVLMILSLSYSLFSQTKMFISTTSGTDSVWLSDVKSIYFKTYLTLPTDSLVAYYPFNGTLQDSSSKKRNLTFQGGTLTYTTDRKGNSNGAVFMDGSSRLYNNSSIGLKSNGDATISAWILPARYSVSGSNDRYTSIAIYDFSNERSIRLWTDSSGLGFPSLPIGNKLIAETLPTSGQQYDAYYLTNNTTTWMHAVSIIRSDSIEIWINGIKQQSTKINGSGSYFSDGMSIGGNNSGNSSQHYKGKIDDVRFYSRALSPAEILALYNDW